MVRHGGQAAGRIGKLLTIKFILTLSRNVLLGQLSVRSGPYHQTNEWKLFGISILRGMISIIALPHITWHPNLLFLSHKSNRLPGSYSCNVVEPSGLQSVQASNMSITYYGT
ncbi:hypothetical protein SERLA73DRAFT_187453 [Serpula lacrymans var. lacrymans S7.3]|uniref:Uncharacterized protein n=2 Tax=Serpula lacrymans var. lacrymans TaxID=341189 RepID=F8Q975_SERL3|nr:uncharacterized protein SERLADRAFT_477044 [Serpula lacrymans var. lacrymans S7.9]EGN95130.1 hypothetical protein SERLA73DRAFT_187453 [Serpula lacrymans var. lacrymans S7.3]EGO20639.1 hypothetical protein SERLADRAFT_477044 [Serpula lacrymans var. lacrymans S7.9]